LTYDEIFDDTTVTDAPESRITVESEGERESTAGSTVMTETVRECGVADCQARSSSEECSSAPQWTEWDVLEPAAAVLATSRLGHLKEE
jgi:hypothetical protein